MENQMIISEPSHEAVEIMGENFYTSIQQGGDGHLYNVLSHTSGQVTQIITPFSAEGGGGLSQIMLISSQVSEWTHDEAQLGNMIARDTEEIQQELLSGKGFLTYTPNFELAAYIRILVWSNQCVEIGSLVVKQTLRGKGYGMLATYNAVQKALIKFPKPLILGLAENEKSAKMVQKMGGIKLSKQVLPDVVWELCFEPNPCKHVDSFPDRCPCIAYDLSNISIPKQ